LSKKLIVIGSGFAGLSAASFMAKAGWQVTVLEKHATPGGRARQLKEDGFVFDMGPSWYWMPDVFERYFQQFGKNVPDYYALQRLDPSYRIYRNDGLINIPAGFDELKKLFESLEPGSAKQLEKFIAEAAYKYNTGMRKLVFKPGLSFTGFLDADIIKGIFRLHIFSSIKKHIHTCFKHPVIRQLLEFPVLFLGALPQNTPALYSLMNYADIIGGTWYPKGGMFSVVSAMHQLAVELGVQFCFNQNVTQISIEKGTAKKVITASGEFEADVVIGAADYHFIESELLPQSSRSYTEAYWNKRTMAPSCLIYYVGLNKRLSDISHHSLFFDTSFEQHADEIYTSKQYEIYTSKQWPAAPLFYVSAPSVTDDAVAPEGCENLFFLIPVAAGLEGDSEAIREKYFSMIVERMEKHTKQSFAGSVIYKKTFAQSDFISEYNSYKGNAYGLANTLMQTAMLKPSCRSKKVNNLFYTGQLTVPGPGVPPCLISGEVVAKEVCKNFR
jgi:phytoene desaturase